MLPVSLKFIKNFQILNNFRFIYSNRYGTILSTKAILDKTTNKCKGIKFVGIEMTHLKYFRNNEKTNCYHSPGYGFVDFDSPTYAEQAVKGLLARGIQAQMAKVGIWVLHRPAIVRLFIACIWVILTIDIVFSDNIDRSSESCLKVS